MLEEVHKVPWATLHGPYGLVKQMPYSLHAMASESAEIANEALIWIDNNTIHQGTRWQSTAPTIPFLIEILNHPRSHRRDDIAWFLLGLAIDEISPLFPAGFDPDAFFSEAKGVTLEPRVVEEIWNTPDWDSLTEKQWEIANQMPLRWHYDAYLAVERDIASLMGLMRDDNHQVRMAAARALAYFPTVATQAVPLLRQAAATEVDPHLLANDLMILGLVGRYANDRSVIPWLEQQLESDHPWIVKVMAALALGTIVGLAISDRALSTLVDVTEADLRDIATHTQRLRLSTSLLGYVWQVLHSLGL
jgi:hypothetical protein